jgi:hypothetical protein
MAQVHLWRLDAGSPECGCESCGKPAVAVLRLTHPGDDSGAFTQVCPKCYDNLLAMERKGSLELKVRVPLPPAEIPRRT